MSRSASAIALYAGFGLLLWGCQVPEYRLKVTSIPSDTAELQVAAYVQGAIAADSPSFAVTGPRDSFTFCSVVMLTTEGSASLTSGRKSGSETTGGVVLGFSCQNCEMTKKASDSISVLRS